MSRLPFALGLAFSTTLATLAGAQQLPGEDPLWPKELRAEGRQAGELRRLRQLAREYEGQLSRLRVKLAEATKEAESRRPTSQPAEQAKDEAQLETLRRQVELLQSELERAKASEPAPEAPAFAPSAPAPEAPALAAPEAPHLAPSAPDFAEREELPASTGADRALSRRIREGGIAAAKRELAEDVLQRIYGRQVLSLLQAEELGRLLDAVEACFRRERVEGGLLRLRCHEAEAQARTLDVLGVDEALGAEPFLVVTNRFEGPSDAGRIAGAAFTDTLQGFRLRAAGRGQRAPLVIALSGRLAFSRMPQGSAHDQLYRGQLRCQAVRVRVFHRPSNQILHHSAITSDAELRADESHPSELHQPWIARDASIGEIGERYADAVGRAAAQRVARTLLVEILRGRGSMSATSRAFTQPDLSQADFVDGEPAPLASGAPAPVAPLEREAVEAPTSFEVSRAPRYVLRFKGLDDAEVDEAIEDLQRNERFARWKHVSSTGDLHVYACDYSGRGVVLRLREALADADVRVSKRGPRLTILPR
tara:strand:- start:225 stop:1832 length:1608 start_codon:yes stop_codon:yes gene_type:complete